MDFLMFCLWPLDCVIPGVCAGPSHISAIEDVAPDTSYAFRCNQMCCKHVERPSKEQVEIDGKGKSISYMCTRECDCATEDEPAHGGGIAALASI